MKANLQSTTYNLQPKSGFTLIELLVSVSIFAMTMLVIVSSLLTMVEANRRGQAISSVVNNLNFALESMTRNARTGTGYLCGGSYGGLSAADCPSGNTVFGYTAANGSSVYYRFVVPSAPVVGYIDRCINPGAPSPVDCSSSVNWIKMTAPEIDIKNGRFYLVGNLQFSAGEFLQPRVIMVLKGEASVVGDISKFNIQTTVAQRTPDR